MTLEDSGGPWRTLEESGPSRQQGALVVMASNLIAMASTPRAMASNLLVMALLVMLVLPMPLCCLFPVPWIADDHPCNALPCSVPLDRNWSCAFSLSFLCADLTVIFVRSTLPTVTRFASPSDFQRRSETRYEEWREERAQLGKPEPALQAMKGL